MTGREKVLVGVGLVIILGGGFEVVRELTSRSAPAPRPEVAVATRPAEVQPVRRTSREAPIVRLDLLDARGVGRVGLDGRSVFAFPPPPPPPPPKPVEPPPPTAEEIAANAWLDECGQPCPLGWNETYGPPPPPPPRPEPPPPPPPPVTYKMIGVFGPPSDWIAALTDGSDIVNVRVGDEIDDKFIVKAIDRDSITFGFVGFDESTIKKVAIGA